MRRKVIKSADRSLCETLHFLVHESNESRYSRRKNSFIIWMRSFLYTSTCLRLESRCDNKSSPTRRFRLPAFGPVLDSRCVYPWCKQCLKGFSLILLVATFYPEPLATAKTVCCTFTIVSLTLAAIPHTKLIEAAMIAVSPDSITNIPACCHSASSERVAIM